jgi:hypothetical protein
MSRTDVFHRAAPWTRLMLRHRRLDDGLNLSWPNRLRVVAEAVLIAGLIGGLWWWPGLIVAAAALVAAVALNGPMLRYFRARRGGAFALRACAWHLVHDACSVAGLAVGLIQHIRAAPRRPVDDARSGRPAAVGQIEQEAPWP